MFKSDAVLTLEHHRHIALVQQHLEMLIEKRMQEFNISRVQAELEVSMALHTFAVKLLLKLIEKQ